MSKSHREYDALTNSPTIGDSNMITSKSAPQHTPKQQESNMTHTPSPTAAAADWANTWTKAKGRVWLSNDELDTLDPAFTPSDGERVNEAEQRINLFAERFLASFPKTKNIRTMRPEPANPVFAAWYIQSDIEAGGSRLVDTDDGPRVIHNSTSILNDPQADELTDRYASKVFWDSINVGYKILSTLSDERRAELMIPDADISCVLPFMDGFTAGGVGSGLEVNGPDGAGGYTKTGYKMYMLETPADVATSTTVHFILIGHRPDTTKGSSFKTFGASGDNRTQEWAPTLLAIRSHIVVKADMDAAIIGALRDMTAETYSGPDASVQAFNRDNREAAKLARLQGRPNHQAAI